MIDHVSEPRRSYIMSRVASKNTGPELTVRQLLHRLGYRYRLHGSDLPGSPDIVFRKRRKVIFVHGCFWHGHACSHGRLPKSNVEYWKAKIASNRARDMDQIIRLADAGWGALAIWQCELKDTLKLTERVAAFLGPPNVTSQVLENRNVL
ncbi:very short patch repair endonuclease [uncultured Thiodictyon sp.]|uniref:very short patch repair endonuclease n=1 Tax=uncultured Thiodictyon sp. TaxID=1846217 RepID=UPI0025DBA0E5|nr:very short patch repair endonuclease [uncultured Thiodictyon sp.]